MKRAMIMILILFCLAPLPVTLGAVKPTVASAEKSELESLIGQLLEVQKKKLTLQYLGDQRSKELLADLIKDFSPTLKKNFRANIAGSYRKVLLENFQAKRSEINLDLAKYVSQHAGETEQLLSFIEQIPFPLNGGFSLLTKKMADSTAFQAGQVPDSSEQQALRRTLDRMNTLLAKLTADAAKDPYEAVKAMYAKTPRRDFPIWWFDDAQHEVGYTTHGENPVPPTDALKRKKWTVLVFLNADNDLEQAGLKDVNEMEKIGSDEAVNIVVQIDRMESGKGDVISEENWTGTRRYLIVRDQSKKIASKMVMNLGERDMGDKRELAEFLKWGVETYPADHFMVVVWNHGAGWKGISVDDQSGKMLSTPDLLWAFSQAKESLAKVNPKHPKFDIVDFDACLMGMIEVAYELKESVDFLLASEETEPGQGMPYTDTLRPLHDNPGISPRQLSREMVQAYVKSYTIGGSQTNKTITGASITKAAYDLTKIVPLVEQVNKLGAALQANHQVYSHLLVDSFGAFAKIRRYSDESFVDLLDFCRKLSGIAEAPAEVKTACQEIITILGYPKLEDRLAKPVVIKRKTPGIVIWGYNGWKMPPQEMRPSKTQVYRSRQVATPLKGPDENGYYVFSVGPFGMVVDPVKKKKEFVQEINYRIIYENGKKSPDMTDRTGREYTLVTDFPATSPLVVEGHTQGMGNSCGMSIYYPYCLDFRTSYKTMQFAKNTCWDEFIATIPQYQRKADVLLTGGMVEDPSTLPYFMDTLQKLQIKFDVLWDPKVFGYKFADILEQYRQGVVFTDSISVNSFENMAPSADELIDYLNGGGSLFIAAQSVEQKNTNTRLLEEFFKFNYVDDDRDIPGLVFADKRNAEVKMSLNGGDSANSASEVTIMECDQPASLLVKTQDGRGAAIGIKGLSAAGNQYRGVFCGFRFESIPGAEQRVALLDKALSILFPAPVLPKPLE